VATTQKVSLPSAFLPLLCAPWQMLSVILNPVGSKMAAEGIQHGIQKCLKIDCTIHQQINAEKQHHDPKMMPNIINALLKIELIVEGFAFRRKRLELEF